MSKTAFLFPGQGSQTVGMGVDIAAESEAAADVLLRIDNALNETLSLIMADGPADTLTLTQNAQPALFASSLGVLRALEAHTGTSASQIADYVAGHSLGEYSAFARLAGLNLTKRPDCSGFAVSPCSRQCL